MTNLDSTRRKYLRIAGSMGVGGMLAGCTGGGDGGDGGGDGSGDGSSSGGGSTSMTTTASGSGDDEMDSSSMGPEEWREMASERAAEELQSGTLKVITSRISDEYRQYVLDKDYTGVYEPLKGNIEAVASGNTTQIRQKYTRLLASGNKGMDILDDVRIAPLVAEGVPFMDLTDVPSYQDAPEFVKVEPYQATTRVSAYGQIYNEDLVSSPPETWDDLLEFGDGEIGLDYTPSIIAVAYVMQVAKSEDFVRQLEANSPVLYDSNRNLVRSCGQGEVSIAFLGGLGQAYQNAAQGLPTRPVENPDQWVWYARPLSVSAQPERPWAAKLYIDAFLNEDNPDMQMSELGSLAFNGETGRPQEMVDLFQGKVWKLEDFEGTPQDILATYQELVNAPVA